MSAVLLYVSDRNGASTPPACIEATNSYIRWQQVYLIDERRSRYVWGLASLRVFCCCC